MLPPLSRLLGVLQFYIQDYFLNRVWRKKQIKTQQYPVLIKKISPIWGKNNDHPKPQKHTSLGLRQKERKRS